MAECYMREAILLLLAGGAVLLAVLGVVANRDYFYKVTVPVTLVSMWIAFGLAALFHMNIAMVVAASATSSLGIGAWIAAQKDKKGYQ